jgi:hypothetical protein
MDHGAIKINVKIRIKAGLLIPVLGPSHLNTDLLKVLSIIFL